MTFVPVEELPKDSRGKKIGDEVCDYHKHESELNTFMKMGVRIARIDFAKGESKDQISLATSIRRAVKTLGLPIDVHRRNSRLYLVRRDI